MAQAIKNVKAGQLFEVVGMSCKGFDLGCIIKALDDITNVKRTAGDFKWVGGFRPSGYNCENIVLTQNVQDLKRYRGKIK